MLAIGRSVTSPELFSCILRASASVIRPEKVKEAASLASVLGAEASRL